MPKKKWESITADDLEEACGHAIGPQRNRPLLPHLEKEYFDWPGGHDWAKDFPEWEPVHNILFKNGILGIKNAGGDLGSVFS